MKLPKTLPASTASFVYDDAVAESPFSQAAKNFSVVSRTSSAPGGPVCFAALPPSPLSAVTKLYAPYPAPPTIAANTPPTMATLTPLRMTRPPL